MSGETNQGESMEFIYTFSRRLGDGDIRPRVWYPIYLPIKTRIAAHLDASPLSEVARLEHGTQNTGRERLNVGCIAWFLPTWGGDTT